jgi:hypothetical protein
MGRRCNARGTASAAVKGPSHASIVFRKFVLAEGLPFGLIVGVAPLVKRLEAVGGWRGLLVGADSCRRRLLRLFADYRERPKRNRDVRVGRLVSPILPTY